MTEVRNEINNSTIGTFVGRDATITGNNSSSIPPAVSHEKRERDAGGLWSLITRIVNNLSGLGGLFGLEGGAAAANAALSRQPGGPSVHRRSDRARREPLVGARPLTANPATESTKQEPLRVTVGTRKRDDDSR
jgi:hypothetical protein